VVEKSESLKTPAESLPVPISVEKAQEVIFQPNPGPQTDFLSSSEQEVLYGGAAGGGKSYAMLADPVRYFNNPLAKMLLVRRSTEELRELISVSKQLYPKAIPGIKFLERDKTWVAPSGATLWLSYLDRDDDVSRYQGQAFCVAEGTKVRVGDNNLKKIEDLQVGESVQTLEGPQQILWKSEKLKKKCVKVSVFSSDGHLLSEQIQPDSHPIGLLSSKPYQQLSDLSQSISQFHRYPLQWLSYKQLQSENQENPEPFFSQEDGQNGCRVSEDDIQESQQPLGLFYPAVRFVPPLQSSEGHASTQCRAACKHQGQSEGLHTETLKRPLGPLQLDGLFLQNEGHTSLCSHQSCGDVSNVQIGMQKVEGSQGCYYSCSCQCDEPLLSSPVSDQDVSPSQVDAEVQGPYDPRLDEMGCTPECNRYLVEKYTHPYTEEQRELKVPLELCIVRVEPLSEPLSSVYDLTVNLSNNYITESGLVNKNCWIGFDELTQWPTPFAWNYMRSRLRTAKGSGLDLYQRATSNPGGSGHSWVKKTFVDPAPYNESFWATDIDSGETICWPKGHSRAGEPLFKRRFIPATLFDNPHLSDDGMYEANLLSLPEHQRRQLLEGDWSVSEGAAFSEFSSAIHTVEPFDIPSSWTKFRAADYGYGSHSGVLWFAVVPHTEQLVVYREMYTHRVTAVDLADMILEVESGEKMRYGVLDSSLWHNRGDTGPSLAEQMIMRGCRWRPADRSRGSRVAGKNEVHRRLQVDEYTEEPRMVIFNTCRNLISQLPALPLDKNNPEDVDTKSEDHLYDALRYGLMSRPKSNLFDYDPTGQNSKFQPADKIMGY